MESRKAISQYVQSLNNPKAEMRVHQILCLIRNKSKTMTKEGKAILVMNYYASVLPMLKEYILKFQTQKPFIHKLHDHQMATTKKFLVCFIKAEFVQDLSPKQLASLDDGITHHLDLKDMFIGKITGDILKEESKPHYFLIK